MSEAFSAIIIVGALVFPEVIFGFIEASNYAQTIFHPVGTCKMGQDNMSVVDEKLKVKGIKNLRVIDASIMPNITSGNTLSLIHI